jgi:hypothetical protein
MTRRSAIIPLLIGVVQNRHYAAVHWTQYSMGRGKDIRDLYGNRLPLFLEHGYWITIADALVLHCS